MEKAEEDALRDRIGQLLARGLITDTRPVEGDAALRSLLNQLHDVDPDDLERKLALSGFVNHKSSESDNTCHDCMYYLIHRKWCALPELSLPVEPEWWCRLWRI